MSTTIKRTLGRAAGLGLLLGLGCAAVLSVGVSDAQEHPPTHGGTSVPGTYPPGTFPPPPHDRDLELPPVPGPTTTAPGKAATPAPVTVTPRYAG